MKSGTCPKCASTDVRFKKGYTQRGYIMLGFLSSTRLVDYICPDCGYVEQYLENLDWDCQAIREKWPRVRDAGKHSSVFKDG